MKTKPLVCPKCGKYPFQLVAHKCGARELSADSLRQVEQLLQASLTSLQVVGEHRLATVRAEKQLRAAQSEIAKALKLIKAKTNVAPNRR